MDLETLRFGNFGSLGEAINDWSQMLKNLKTLEKDAREDLKGKADKANWAGLNATVSRQFITKTAGEFTDAHTQATTIHNILRNTRDELVKYRKELNEAIDRGLKKNITVVSTQGGGFTVTMNVHPDRAAKGTKVPEHSQQDVDTLRDEVERILNQATESDTTAARALRAIADQAEFGFSGAAYKDRDSAAEALKKADEMAAIAKKDPKDLTVEEFDKLNAGLKKYANDDLFSEAFAKNLGAQGVVDFWADINSPNANWELNRARHDKFADLQKNLSLALANATQSDSPAMHRWEKDIVGLGNDFVPKDNPRAMGFQVMSSLMRWGDYDDKFLKDYGTELIKTEKERSGNGRDLSLAWRLSPGELINRTGTDSGADPMTGFMKALANSPEAATDFFNDTFVTKDEDHEFLKDTDDDGKKGKVSLTNFDYLFEERDWPAERDSKGEESVTGRNSMAHALEAATTGHPAGSPPSVDTIPHSKEQSELYESLVKSVSEEPDRLLKHGFMSDSLGKITAEYMPDINRALNPDIAHKDKLFPMSGEVAEFGQSDVTRFLHTVGRNPEGYAAVNLGQHNYTTALMEHHFRHPDAYISDPKFSVTTHEVV